MDKYYLLEQKIDGLEEKLLQVSEQVKLALSCSRSDPQSSLTKARIILEKLVTEVYEIETGKKPAGLNLGGMLKDHIFTAKIKKNIISRMHNVRSMANHATHGEEVNSEDAIDALEDLCIVLEWYFNRYKAAHHKPRKLSERLSVLSKYQFELMGGFMLLTALVLFLVLNNDSHDSAASSVNSKAAEVKSRPDPLHIDKTKELAIKDFVLKFEESCERNNVSEYLSFFDEEVVYYGKKWTREQIRKDRGSFYTNWSNRVYIITSEIKVTHPGISLYQVEYDLNYKTKDKIKDKYAKGVWHVKLVIADKNGELLITQIYGKEIK